MSKKYVRFLLLILAAARLSNAAEGEEFFEKRIRPLLAERCYGCHSAAAPSVKAGLLLDSAAGVRKGGEGGPVIVAGDPEASRLIRAVRYGDPKLQMPPQGKLQPQQIADLAAWVKMGAPDPRSGPAAGPKAAGIDFARARKHWAFQPLRTAAPPQVSNRSWVRTPVDAFLLAKLDAAKLKPAPPAERRTLIRRVYMDVLGLPPSPAEVEEFAHDESAGAWESLVGRLLDSPHYGERWARHWLDLVRYAETDGHEFDVDKPNAWRYRDYVIRALNADLPYDQFLREHLAGDKVSPPRVNAKEGISESRMGTAFFQLGEVINTPVDSVQANADRIDNQIDVFGKAVLGLTVACARCHDHKFDPIPSSDYYALSGFLHSSRLRQLSVDSPEVEREIAARIAELKAITARIDRLQPPERVQRAPVPPGYTEFEPLSGEDFGSWRTTGLGLRVRDGMITSAGLSNRLQGIAVSKQFTIGPRYLHVRMKGGEVALISDEYRTKGGGMSAAGDFEWRTWDCRMIQNKPAYFEISDLDRSRSVTVDRILASENSKPPAEPLPAVEIPAPLTAADRDALESLLARKREIEDQIPDSVFAIATTDDEPRDVRVHLRGNHKNLGAIAPRHFLTVFAGDQDPVPQGSGRDVLAERTLATAQALVARVAVNRVWKHHFGEGLVRTPDNFGLTGEPPSHPELLDWLASDFVQHGWSLKRIHRTILMSNAYRMASTPDARADEADPRNVLLHRMPVRRLEAEALRDQMLAVSGALDRTAFGPSVPPYVSPFMDGDPRGKPRSGPLDGEGRRSVYIQVRRNYLSDTLLAFDYPQPTTTIGRRNVSTVPSQALLLLNNEFVWQQAGRLAAALLRDYTLPEERVRQAYLRAFARQPEASELRDALQLTASLQARFAEGEEKAWTDLCHVLLNTTEFLFLR